MTNVEEHGWRRAVIVVTWFWQANLMTTTADFGVFVLSQAAGGAFIGLAYMLTNVVIMRAVNPTAVAPSLALVRLGQQIGGSVGSALIVTVMNRSFDQYSDVLRTAINVTRPVISQFVSQHGVLAPALLLNMVSAQATALAQADGSRFLGLIVLVSSPLALLIRRSAKVESIGAEQRRAEPRVEALSTSRRR
jgi:hypothetical protein